MVCIVVLCADTVRDGLELRQKERMSEEEEEERGEGRR